MNDDWLGSERDALATNRILDAAGELFVQRGVKGVSMADVAAAAGCSRATVYRYFENRDALRAAFVNRHARLIAASVAEDLAAITDPATRLAEAIVATLAAVRADPTLDAWFTQAAAGTASAIAASSPVIESLTAGAVRDAMGPEVGDLDIDARARWLVRCITSLLAVPGRDPADERAIVVRFVVPSVLGAPPIPAGTLAGASPRPVSARRGLATT